jgi:Salmonella virulence plasmid 65kDa B protein
LQGIGEKFSADLHTGSGHFMVPIALPLGRNRFQHEPSLIYSSGNGNGLFGLGWSPNIPEVSRKRAKGVPLYQAQYHVSCYKLQSMWVDVFEET